MMAFNRNVPPQGLEPETLQRLRTALERFARDGNNSGALHEALREASAEARHKNIQAEQLLVILKELWYEIPDVKRAAGSPGQRVLLQRVITKCIQEYYGATPE